MTSIPKYDVAIVGGGLSGLSLSIQLSRQGYSVIVYEKEKYPFHRVCGEYISMESWDFLKELGLDLDYIKPSLITRIQVSGLSGKLLKQDLPQGGFGISRYRLDDELQKLARASGVVVSDSTRVTDINSEMGKYRVSTNNGDCICTLAIAAYGKRSNFDIKWKRSFAIVPKSKNNNYVGVKYHIKTDMPADTIALHNFVNGYCGIVKVEDDKYCLCYLTSAANLSKTRGDLRMMEERILWKNPFLKKIWAESEFLYDSPVTISQISFEQKSLVDHDMLMIGDAAGMIAPLCGNGMSMALHGSKLAADSILSFLGGQLSPEAMEDEYSKRWRQEFGRRMKTGRLVQRTFGKKWVTGFLLTAGKMSPWLVNTLIRRTHGRPF